MLVAPTDTVLLNKLEKLYNLPEGCPSKHHNLLFI